LQNKYSIKAQNPKQLSMQAFTVRPFGTRKVLKKGDNGNNVPVDFDFERVHNELIAPAIIQAGLQGGTTGEIFEAGSIHEDMFSLLMTAHLVVVDISIHNANVFYEMGIRHALRDKRTVLIKCPGFDETPFDILGYRYISYDKENPSASVNALVKAIEATLSTDRKDSPVFDKLPSLESQDPEMFLVVPDDFEVDIRVTKTKENAAAKLAMMATEISNFQWYIPGLRKIGEALFSMRCLEPAKEVWEKVIEYKRNDLQANDRLATIYQRLAEGEIKDNLAISRALLEKSDIAIEQVLTNRKVLTPWKRAESYALMARNAKTLWLESWKRKAEEERPSSAIQSEHLRTAMEMYERSFKECLNHFYPGINALGLLIITTTLAGRYPDIWALHFKTQKQADLELEELQSRYEVLKQAVSYSIEASKETLDKSSEEYAWLKITEADFICLTETRPARVKLSYQNTLREASDLNMDATVRQLLIYKQLGVLSENVAAALEALPAMSLSGKKSKPHTLLFTGHMIDKPGRQEERFPERLEQSVKKAIKAEVQEELENINGEIIGIAGGACGGDIIFHEVCEELGIRTEMYLALPRDQYITESVAFAGPEWIDRFDRLYEKQSKHILAPTKELPKWLSKKENFTIWERTNLWMLNQALSNGGQHMSLIALWNGKGGDAAGGTEHMVNEAGRRGAKRLVVDITKLQTEKTKVAESGGG
jgi:hypothetical protein